MTEKEGQCGPSSPLCKATVVIGSEQGCTTADSQGIPLLYFRGFFFFYLLRCCSSSQNKSFIAISSWPCTRTPGALIELPSSGIINNPKSTRTMSLSFFVFGGGLCGSRNTPPTSLHLFFSLSVQFTERIWIWVTTLKMLWWLQLHGGGRSEAGTPACEERVSAS